MADEPAERRGRKADYSSGKLNARLTTVVAFCSLCGCCRRRRATVCCCHYRFVCYPETANLVGTTALLRHPASEGSTQNQFVSWPLAKFTNISNDNSSGVIAKSLNRGKEGMNNHAIRLAMAYCSGSPNSCREFNAGRLSYSPSRDKGDKCKRKWGESSALEVTLSCP